VVNTLDGPIEDAGDGLLEVANAGTGFMLIERAVLDGLTGKVAAYRSGDKVFHQFFGTSIDPDSGVGCRRISIFAGWRGTTDIRCGSRRAWR
jgi:hypothetical protein